MVFSQIVVKTGLKNKVCRETRGKLSFVVDARRICANAAIRRRHN